MHLIEYKETTHSNFRVASICDFITGALDRYDYDRSNENVNDQAARIDAMHEAFGRLIEELVTSGALDLYGAARIAGVDQWLVRERGSAD